MSAVLMPDAVAAVLAHLRAVPVAGATCRASLPETPAHGDVWVADDGGPRESVALARHRIRTNVFGKTRESAIDIARQIDARMASGWDGNPIVSVESITSPVEIVEGAQLHRFYMIHAVLMRGESI